MFMLSLLFGTAGGRIIATLSYMYRPALVHECRSIPPVPPELNVEEARCGNGTTPSRLMLTPPTRTESMIATLSHDRPAAAATTLNFGGGGMFVR